MATGLVIHISSGEDRHTDILSDDNLRIGACDTCDLRLRASSLPKSAANAVLLELSRQNGSYRVTNFDPSIALTQNGQLFRLKGYGMPSVGNGEETGDLYARVDVQLPTRLSDKEREHFDALKKLGGDDSKTSAA